MADISLCQCHKIDDFIVPKKTIIKWAIILVLLFCVLLIVNDLILYHYLSNSKKFETLRLTTYEEEPPTTPG